MASKCSRMYKQCFILLLLVLLYQTEAKPKGGRRTGGSGGSKYNSGSRHTQTHNTGSNYGGSHYNTGSNSGHHDTYHQSHSYNTGNSNPVVPSAPVASGTNNQHIGFEHFNTQQHAGSGSQSGRHDLGFENVHNRVGGQNNNHPTQNPIGFNVNQQHRHGGHNSSSGSGGFYGGTHHNTNNNNNYNQQTRYNSSLNSGHPGGNQNGYYPGNSGIYNQPHGHQQYPHSPYIQQNPPGGYYNPNLAQPGGYYHQYQAVPNGPPPQIYQPYPVKQSSGGSALGYVGSLAGGLAGGYLIGRLTSGGGHSSDNYNNNNNNGNYVVHHYHHNSNEVPKQFSVSNGSLATCSQNATQGLCVPNTFPICLFNGTIMCVTHTLYTTPCTGLNTSSACVISLLPPPCANGDANCTATNNTNTTAVYVPCISNVTLTNPGQGNVVAPSSGASGQSLVGDKVELCVTAIAEPKYTPPLPQIQGAGPPPPAVGYNNYNNNNNNQLTKSQGNRQSFTSGWALSLIIVLWVGIK